MLQLLHTRITTQRLLLLPVAPEYVDDIFNEFTAKITTYMYPSTPKRREETMEFIIGAREAAEKGEELQVSIFKNDTNEFLGGAGLHNLQNEMPELGIWIKHSAHHHGYGKEAILGLIDFAKQHTKATHLCYPVDKDNLPSRKIPESLGGIIMRAFDKLTPRGVILHTLEYSIPMRDK